MGDAAQVVHLEGVAHAMEADMGAGEEAADMGAGEEAGLQATAEDMAMAEDKVMERDKVAMATVITASIRGQVVTTGACVLL